MNDAWHPWIPTLIELEHQKSLEPDDSAVDWSRFGWEALEVPADAPHVAARMDKLGEMFLERFANRMLNSETLERWQVRLQHTMDRIAPVYERAYSLYEKHAQALQDGALPGRTEAPTSAPSPARTRRRGREPTPWEGRPRPPTLPIPRSASRTIMPER